LLYLYAKSPANMKQILIILIFFLWTWIANAQTAQDSLAELQSLLDSIPDISLAELGIDTTAEIVPDTLHLVIPAFIASDTAYARSRLNQAIDLIKAGKYDDAYAKADTAKHIYQMNLGYATKEVADCLHQMGRSFYFLNSNELSLMFIKKSYLLKIKLRLEIGNSLNLLGLNFEDLKSFENAIFCHKLCLIERLKNLDTFNIDIGDSFHNLGDCYSSLGKHSMAINKYINALKIRNKVLDPLHKDIVNSNYQLSFSYSAIGEYKKALNHLFKTLEIEQVLYGPIHIDLGQTYLAIGTTYSYLYNFKKSVEFLNKALHIYKNYDEFNTNKVYSLLANTYNNWGDFDKAIDYGLKAVSILNRNTEDFNEHYIINQYVLLEIYKSKKDYQKALDCSENVLKAIIKHFGHDQMIIGGLYTVIGNLHTLNKKHDLALEFTLRGIEIELQTVDSSNFSISESYNILGIIYKNMNKYQLALDCFNKSLAIKIRNLGTESKEVAQTLENLGNLYFITAKYAEAKESYHLVIQIRKKILDEQHPLINSSLYDLALTYQKLNQIDSSLFYLHQAISGIKSQMASDISSETKSLYQSQNVPVFESAIDVSLIKAKQDQHDSLKLKTYEYTELAKASLLQSQIKQTDALAFAGIPDSLLQKEYDLRIDINWREKQRQGLLEKGKTETDTTVLRISSIIFDLKRAQEALFQTLEKDYPEYYRLKYDTKTISLEDTQQKLLQKDQTLLEYFVGDSSIFIFVVRPDTFDVVHVKKDFPLDSLVGQMQTGLYGYYGQLADKRSDIVYKNSITDYSHAAQALYQRIMAPVAHLLTPDLVIIPDGVLGYVPFEALLKSKPEKLNQFGSYPFIINDHTISYNYSATLWNEMKSKKHKKEPMKSLVAFAPFYEGSFTLLDSTINLVFDTLPDGRDTTIFQDIVSRKTYAPLPSSGIEAGTVSKMWKGDYFIDKDATEQRFYDVAGDYRMVHLSTHGVADARQGDYSYLAFAEQKDSIENEFLYVRDIYNTQLNADLVFLSACETAQGELQRGEGIISLARAFAYAGAKSIFTTLWQVDDTATKDISIDFYKNLKKGFPKDVALRQAKLRHIKSAKSAQKHPFFWAAMIGIGDMGEVK
jgi:CHAT domain-containing protein/lipopolysaccharide biosynthesis regulator YciM